MRWFVHTSICTLSAGTMLFVLGASCGGSTAENTSGSQSTGTTSNGSGAASAGGSGAGASSSSGYSSGVGGAPTVSVPCQGHTYECGDLVDNDGDGLMDYQDPDCLGPCDNTENSFYGGIPGQAGPPCLVDCYFDQDSGQGNDQCYWSHWCDPHETSPDYYPEPNNGTMCTYDAGKSVPVSTGAPQSCDELYNTQTQACYDYCGPLTPNGCDCFGCCELPAGSGEYVWLGSQGATGGSVCTMADLTDPTKCHPCLPVKACLNGCDPCELCIGKPAPGPECYPDSGMGEQCPTGVQPCGLAGQEECPPNYYCITGCCQPIPN